MELPSHEPDERLVEFWARQFYEQAIDLSSYGSGGFYGWGQQGDEEDYRQMARSALCELRTLSHLDE